MLVWRGVFRFVSKCKWVRIDQDPGPQALERMPSADGPFGNLTREDVDFQVWSSVLQPHLKKFFFQKFYDLVWR